jgi:hypothetical protein
MSKFAIGTRVRMLDDNHGGVEKGVEGTVVSAGWTKGCDVQWDRVKDSHSVYDGGMPMYDRVLEEIVVEPIPAFDPGVRRKRHLIINA